MEETDFDSVQGTTTKLYWKVQREGVTQKWTKSVSSLRVINGKSSSSSLLVACVPRAHGAPRALDPNFFHFNHRKRYVCTGPSTVILVGFLMLPQTVFAYLDAGTGSQILQIAIATSIGAVFALKASWHKIKALFGKVWKVKK